MSLIKDAWRGAKGEIKDGAKDAGRTAIQVGVVSLTVEVLGLIRKLFKGRRRRSAPVRTTPKARPAPSGESMSTPGRYLA